MYRRRKGKEKSNQHERGVAETEIRVKISISISEIHVRGLSIQHPLGSNPAIPKKLSPERLAELTKLLRSGEMTFQERDELAKGFIRVALSIAAKMCRHTRDDEIASAALFGVVYALDKAREKLKDDNLQAWIISCIISHCRRFRARDHMAPVPPTTYLVRAKKGLKTHNIIFVDVKNPGEDRYFKSRIATSAIKETLDLAAEDDMDRQIIKYRLEGYNDREISVKLGVSNSLIFKRRSGIETRYERLEKA